MLRKRIIFTLIYSDGFFMQSRNFRLQKVGDLNWLKKNYKIHEIAFSIDELIVLNVSRNNKSICEFAKIVESLVSNVFIPVSAGGGIRKIEDAEVLFNNGADKIVLNSTLFTDLNLVSSLVKKYGSQSILASVDYKLNDNRCEVYINDGTTKLDLELNQYISHLENLDIGEIYLNSIDRDGTGFGYDFDTINKYQSIIQKPLIIAGGAGNHNHFNDGLLYENVSAVATANLFNFIGNGLLDARTNLINLQHNLANWNANN